MNHESGWHLSGCVEGVKVEFLVDTGAVCTLISSVFSKIKQRCAVKLRPYHPDLQLADGSVKEIEGVCCSYRDKG